MSAPAKRVQFFLKEDVLAQVEQLGSEYDKSLSAICGQLIKEALATRGLLDYEVPSSADLSPSTERPKTILEKVFPKQPSISVLKSEVPRETSTSTQEMKLKLMTELMEQLKSL